MVTYKQPLTQRECDVLKLVADGLTNEDVGCRLFITDLTVKYHLKRICKKLGAINRSNAVAIALRQELIS